MTHPRDLVPVPHWHAVNPWADSIVYVPLAELVEALTAPDWYRSRANLAPYGTALDAYVLPQPDGRHSAGIRFSARDSDYLSPLGDAAKLQALLERYR